MPDCSVPLQCSNGETDRGVRDLVWLRQQGMHQCPSSVVYKESIGVFPVLEKRHLTGYFSDTHVGTCHPFKVLGGIFVRVDGQAHTHHKSWIRREETVLPLAAENRNQFLQFDMSNAILNLRDSY